MKWKRLFCQNQIVTALCVLFWNFDRNLSISINFTREFTIHVNFYRELASVPSVFARDLFARKVFGVKVCSWQCSLARPSPALVATGRPACRWVLLVQWVLGLAGPWECPATTPTCRQCRLAQDLEGLACSLPAPRLATRCPRKCRSSIVRLVLVTAVALACSSRLDRSTLPTLPNLSPFRYILPLATRRIATPDTFLDNLLNFIWNLVVESTANEQDGT